LNNYFNYFTEVEEYFVRKRGRNLLISPLDWCLVELWRDTGIPLHIVLRGIERSFESTARRQKSSPNTLFYCHQAILEAFQEYQDAMVGASEDEEVEGVLDVSEATAQREAILGYLKDLEKRLQGREDEVFQRAGQRIAALSSEVSVAATINYQEIDRDLAEMGSVLASALKEDMGLAKVRELGLEVRKELKVYRKRLSKEMYQRLEENYLNRQILGHYDLPEFNLLGIE
jgi:hypothetical protein